ncbi:MAG: multiple sugar transport system substrate-binding protein [Halanaerobiales bacterium]|nr:multiple sugar transport system substrate-binding protein [Halanaerobiales bacterium]
MKKKLSLIIAGMLLMALLIPFGVLAAGKTEIEFWTTETEEARMAVIKELVKDFEKLNPDIKVNVVAVQENDVPTKLAAGMAAGMLPEVVEMGAENILRLGAEGMMDVKAAGQIIDELGRDDFYKGALKMVATPEGGNYAVPMHGWVQGIWYRTDLFEEKGLEPPTTWENILKAAEAFHNPKERLYGIVIGTDKDSYARQTFTQYALANNARIFDENGNIIFNSPEMIETLDYYAKLAQFTPPGPNTWRDARDLYLAGLVPMMMYSTYIMDDIGISRTGYKGAIVENLVDKTALANVMINKSSATFGQIVALGILKGNKENQVEATKKFVKYLMSDAAYIDFLHMAPGGMNPTRRSIAKDPRYLDNEVIKVYGEKAAEIAAGLDNIGKFGYVKGKVFPEIGKITSQFIIGETIMKMTEHGWSAEKAAEWAQKQMEEAVKQ